MRVYGLSEPPKSVEQRPFGHLLSGFWGSGVYAVWFYGFGFRIFGLGFWQLGFG